MGCGHADTQQEWLDKARRGLSYELLCVATNAEGMPALQIKSLWDGGYYNIYSEDGRDYLFCGTIKVSDKDLFKRGYSKIRKDMPFVADANATQPLDDGLVQGRTLDEWMEIGYQNNFLPEGQHTHPNMFEDKALQHAFINSLSVMETLEMVSALSKGKQPRMHTDQPTLPGFEGFESATTDVDPFLAGIEDSVDDADLSLNVYERPIITGFPDDGELEGVSV